MDFIVKSTRQSCEGATEDSVPVCMEQKTRQVSRKVTARTIAKGRLGIPNISNDINALKLSRIRKLKTSDNKRKDIIKSNNRKMLLLEQLGSNLPTQE